MCRKVPDALVKEYVIASQHATVSVSKTDTQNLKDMLSFASILSLLCCMALRLRKSNSPCSLIESRPKGPCIQVFALEVAKVVCLQCGCGSKFKSQGYAGVGLGSIYLHLPRGHFGYIF